MLTIADTGGQHSTITSLLALRVVSPSLSASRKEFDRELRDDAGLRSSIVGYPEVIQKRASRRSLLGAPLHLTWIGRCPRNRSENPQDLLQSHRSPVIYMGIQ